MSLCNYKKDVTFFLLSSFITLSVSGERQVVKRQNIGVQISGLSLIICVTLGKLLHLHVAQLSHLKMGIIMMMVMIATPYCCEHSMVQCT